MFHLGATQVQCALCHTINRVASNNNNGNGGGGHVERQDVSHCRCRGCGVTLMYTRGATSVSCGACHVVTNTAGIAAEGGGVNSTASKSSGRRGERVGGGGEPAGEVARRKSRAERERGGGDS